MSGNRVPLIVPGAIASGSDVWWQGGVAAFEAVAGSFSTATATLTTTGPDSATQLTVGASTTVTANAFVTPLYLPEGLYRVTVTGGTPTNLYVSLIRIPIA